MSKGAYNDLHHYAKLFRLRPHLAGIPLSDRASVPLLNKSDHIARHLLDRIIQRGLAPGSTLGTEAELLEDFGVSRPTLREALRILEAQGVLALRPGPKGGIFVAELKVQNFAQSLSLLLRLNGHAFDSVLRARFAIEPVLARGAAQNGTEADFTAMEATIDRLEAADADMRAVYTENRAFHNLIAKAAGNPVLEVFWSTIRVLASGEGAGLRYSATNRRHIVAAHRAIVEAFRARDADRAETLITEHLRELETLLRRRHSAELDQPARVQRS